MNKNKKLSEYTQDIKVVFQKAKRNPIANLQFQKKNIGVKMLLNQLNSEIHFRNRIVGR